jgi:hypothetical protein
MPNTTWEKVLEARSKLEGWTYEEKSRYMYDLVLQIKPEVVVEVGVWKGLSLASFCAASIDHPCKVFAVDPWSEAAMDENGYGKNLGERQWNSTPSTTIFSVTSGILNLMRTFASCARHLGMVHSSSPKIPSIFCI